MIRCSFTLLALATAILLPSCLTSTVTLDYLPNKATNMRGPSSFQVGSVDDLRGMEPTFIGGVGLPNVVNLENIYLRVPTSEAVKNAFLHALDARKMLARNGGYKVNVEVLDLHCELLKSPYAVCKLRVTTTSGGRVLHSKEYTAERQSVYYVRGSGDPVPLLRELTSRALQDAVDRALDDREMRAKLHH